MIITPTNDVNNTTSSVSPFDSYHAVNWFLPIHYEMNSSELSYVLDTYIRDSSLNEGRIVLFHLNYFSPTMIE